MSEDKIKQEEILYNQLYERTKNFGRNEFIKELMRLERENKQLKEQLQQRDSVIEETIEAIQNFMTYIDDGFCADMMTFIDILNKYKKEESE